MIAKSYLISLHRLAADFKRSTKVIEATLDRLKLAPALNLDGRRFWSADDHHRLCDYFEEMEAAAHD
jgi:hypothetical protein